MTRHAFELSQAHSGTRSRAWRVVVRPVIAGLGAIATVAVCALPAQAQDAKPAPLLAASGKAAADQFVIVLKGTNDGSSIARKHRVAPGYVYGSSIRGFSAKLTKTQLSAIRRDAAVSYVVPDQEMSISGKPEPTDPSRTADPTKGETSGTHVTGGASVNSVQPGATWGLDRIDQPTRTLDGLYHYTTTGSGVTAYIIDTGIYTAHTQFGGRAVGGYTAIGDGYGTNDCHGHGTHVAGTVGGTTYGVAKSVRLVAVRVLGCDGRGLSSGIIAGIDWVSYNHNGPSVANMSLGGGFSQAVNDAVTNSIAQGVTYAVAAGNSNVNACTQSPASTPGALTVAATNATDTRPSWSNWGSCVDVFAPGVGILSAAIASPTATAIMDGTSMASPHVAGLAALYLQANPYATPATVNAVVTTDAVTGVVTSPSGSPNRLARKWNGTLTSTGSTIYEPDGAYWYQSTSGYIQGWLAGTTGTDPDLYLQRWNGSAWLYVSSSVSVTPNERIVYSGSSGYYRFVVYAYSGGGTYDVWATHPA